MGSFRVNRVAEDIKREIYDIMRTVKDPRVNGILSIVNVEVAPDMSLAKIYVSSLDGIEGAQSAVKGLQSAAGFIRRELGFRIKLRKTPELKFIADNGIEESARITKMLSDLKRTDTDED